MKGLRYLWNVSQVVSSNCPLGFHKAHFCRQVSLQKVTTSSMCHSGLWVRNQRPPATCQMARVNLPVGSTRHASARENVSVCIFSTSLYNSSLHKLLFNIILNYLNDLGRQVFKQKCVWKQIWVCAWRSHTPTLWDCNYGVKSLQISISFLFPFINFLFLTRGLKHKKINMIKIE